MYEENRNQFSMKDLVVQLLFVVLLVFILMWIFPSKQFITSLKDTDSLQPLYDRIFNENILMMKDGAKSYFTTPRLPQNVGDKTKLTLGEMLDKKIVLPFTDSSGKSCDTTASYVEVEKKSDEYVMKVNLKCGNQENYLLVYMGCYDYCKTTICEKNESDVKAPVIRPTNSGKNTCTTCGKVTNTTVNNIVNNVVNIVKPDPTPGTDPDPSQPPKYYCSIVNGKYYGASGNEVEESVYKAECTKPTEQKYYCSIVNGKYYDRKGNKVSKEAYEKDCKSTPEPPEPVITYEYEYIKKTGGTCEWKDNWSDWTETVLQPNAVTQVKTKTRTRTITYKKITSYKVTQYYDTSKPIYKEEKVPAGSYQERQCASYKTVTVGTGKYKETTSTHYEVLDASVSVGPNYKLVTEYYDNCNNTCSSHLVRRWLVTETTREEITTTKQECASYKTVTIPMYTVDKVFVGYEIVTKKEPVYGYVDQVIKTQLYSSRTCEPKNGDVLQKWSTSKNDKTLLNSGYTFTGNSRVKK